MAYKGFSSFSHEQTKFLFQTYFLGVGSSLVHILRRMFSDLSNRLGSKIRQKEVAGGGIWQPPSPPLSKN